MSLPTPQPPEPTVIYYLVDYYTKTIITKNDNPHYVKYVESITKGVKTKTFFLYMIVNNALEVKK